MRQLNLHTVVEEVGFEYRSESIKAISSKKWCGLKKCNYNDGMYLNSLPSLPYSLQ